MTTSAAGIAAVQIFKSVGFHSARISALDALADLALSTSCAASAAPRTPTPQSPAGRASTARHHSGNRGSRVVDHHHCLVGSCVVHGIKIFVETVEEVPFACPIPRFLVRMLVRKAPSFAQIGEEPPKKHIPEWLPAFPDPHTYVSTPMWNERSGDPRMDKLEQARQRCWLLRRQGMVGHLNAGTRKEGFFPREGPGVCILSLVL